MPRSIEALVEEQVRRWQLSRQKPEVVERRPVVTVTGADGAQGDELAQQLAKDLGFDHFDREMIHRIAESAQLSERVVASVDGTKRELLTDWLAALASSRVYLSPTQYRYHLARVIGAIAQQGGAVILGRGAHLLLGRGEALRVLAVAPLEDRVRSVMHSHELPEREARQRIVEVDADRRAFILTHFHAEFADPAAFDLVVNTAALGLDGSSAAIPVCARGLARRLEPVPSAGGRQRPGATHVVDPRQEQQDHQEGERCRDHDDGQPRAVAHVHEVEDHERGLRRGDAERHHQVERAEVEARHDDAERRQDREQHEDRQVHLPGHDVARDRGLGELHGQCFPIR